MGLSLLNVNKLIRKEYVEVWRKINFSRILTLEMYSFNFKMQNQIAQLKELMAHPAVQPVEVRMPIWLYRVRPQMSKDVRDWLKFWTEIRAQDNPAASGFEECVPEECEPQEQHLRTVVRRTYRVFVDEKVPDGKRRQLLKELGRLERKVCGEAGEGIAKVLRELMDRRSS